MLNIRQVDAYLLFGFIDDHDRQIALEELIRRILRLERTCEEHGSDDIHKSNWKKYIVVLART